MCSSGGFSAVGALAPRLLLVLTLPSLSHLFFQSSITFLVLSSPVSFHYLTSIALLSTFDGSLTVAFVNLPLSASLAFSHLSLDHYASPDAWYLSSNAFSLAFSQMSIGGINASVSRVAVLVALYAPVIVLKHDLYSFPKSLYIAPVSLLVPVTACQIGDPYPTTDRITAL